MLGEKEKNPLALAYVTARSADPWSCRDAVDGNKGAKTSHQSSRRTCPGFAQLHAASLLSSDQHTGTGILFYWVDLQAAHKTRAHLSKTEKNDMLLLCQYNGCFVFN